LPIVGIGRFLFHALQDHDVLPQGLIDRLNPQPIPVIRHSFGRASGWLSAAAPRPLAARAGETSSRWVA